MLAGCLGIAPFRPRREPTPASTPAAPAAARTPNQPGPIAAIIIAVRIRDRRARRRGRSRAGALAGAAIANSNGYYYGGYGPGWGYGWGPRSAAGAAAGKAAVARGEAEGQRSRERPQAPSVRLEPVQLLRPPAAAGRPDLGFLDPALFRSGTRRIRGFEKLGFPWILSSEMSLFNGLRGIFRKKNSRAPVPRRAAAERGSGAPERAEAPLAWRGSIMGRA